MKTAEQKQLNELQKLNGHRGDTWELQELVEDLGFEVWDDPESGDWRIVLVGVFLPDGSDVVAGRIVFDGRRHRIQL